MKKIIALALALIMALSMASVAFAAATPDAFVTKAPWEVDAGLVYPGESIEIKNTDWVEKDSTQKGTLNGWKISEVDFTEGDLCGASLIDDVYITKEKDAVRIDLKESYTMALEDAKVAKGEITLLRPNDEDGNGKKDDKEVIEITFTVNNKVEGVTGAKKASGATVLTAPEYGKNTVTVMDEDGGYVTFTEGELTGTVKMGKDEKAYLNIEAPDADTKDAIEEYLGEDYEAIVEMYAFETKAFKADVDFRYDAYAEDPHFFYVWDGETLKDLGAVYDDDEDVDDYVWTASAEGVLVVTDVEVVAAEEETKNPDTGANDVVGVAAALAVVSLVAAGAVSLKK